MFVERVPTLLTRFHHCVPVSLPALPALACVGSLVAGRADLNALFVAVTRPFRCALIADQNNLLAQGRFSCHNLLPIHLGTRGHLSRYEVPHRRHAGICGLRTEASQAGGRRTIPIRHLSSMPTIELDCNSSQRPTLQFDKSLPPVCEGTVQGLQKPLRKHSSFQLSSLTRFLRSLCDNPRAICGLQGSRWNL